MLDQALFDEFQGRKLNEVNWRSPENFLKLAEKGICIPFADSFVYKGKGFLLTGYPASGKTSTTGRFVGYNNRYSRRLSRDSTTNQFDGKDNFVYQGDKGMDTLVDLDPIRSGNSKYRISAIFHLFIEKGEIREGDLELALTQMFSYPIPYGGYSEILQSFPYPEALLKILQSIRDNTDRELLDKAWRVYENIPVLILPWYDSPNTRYHKLKEAILKF